MKLIYFCYRFIRKLINIILEYTYIFLNKFLLKIFNVKFGKNIKIFNSIYFNKSITAKLVIGNNFKFTSGCGINPICRNIKGQIFIEDKAYVKIGNNVGMSSTCIWSKERIIIGNYVKIGGNTIIMDHDAHSLNYLLRNNHILSSEGNSLDQSDAARNQIIIEDDVLIGMNSIILKGVKIGARSIIGAGSIVTNSIPSDCIAAGNPCKVIRKI